MNKLKRILSGVLCAATLAAIVPTFAEESDQSAASALSNTHDEIVQPVLPGNTDEPASDDTDQNSVNGIGSPLPVAPITDLTDTRPEENNVSENELDAYMLGAGYAEDIIDSYSYDMKLDAYNNGYTCDDCDLSYGILTENYCIGFTMNDDGSINIAPEELAEFNRLLNDEETITKILSDKARSVSASEMVRQYAAENGTVFLKTMPMDRALATLANWTARFVHNQKSYDKYTKKSVKNLSYTWTWKYDPVWKLTDTMVMTWSGEFVAQADSIKWSYKLHARKPFVTGNYAQTYCYPISKSGTGATYHEKKAGMYKEIDLVRCPKEYEFDFYTGSFSTDIWKMVYQEDGECATAFYLHSLINCNFDISFSLEGGAPKVKITGKLLSKYDRSPDSYIDYPRTANN